MANISKVRKKSVLIDIGDGIDRTLRYTLNAFALLEEKYGSIDEAMEAMEAGSIMAIRYALWAGLVQDDDAITEMYIGNQLDIEDLEELAEKMNKAMIGDMPVDVSPVPNK